MITIRRLSQMWEVTHINFRHYLPCHGLLFYVYKMFRRFVFSHTHTYTHTYTPTHTHTHTHIYIYIYIYIYRYYLVQLNRRWV